MTTSPTSATSAWSEGTARRVRSPGGRPSARVASLALITISAVATAGWMWRATEWGTRALLLLAVPSLGGLAVVVFVPALRRALDVRLVAVLSGALLVLAVIPRPSDSADLWVYATYGRIIVEHGENPYKHDPAEYPDSFSKGGMFENRPAIYGPAFIAMTGAVAGVAGSSRQAIRLAYQAGAALAVAASLLVLWRVGAGPGALALLGLNPVVIAEVVTEGHNDAYIGLALLVAGVLAARRPYVAALAIAAAALVKLPAGIALVGLVVLVRRRSDWGKTFGVAATGAVPIAVAYLAAAGTALGDVLRTGNQVNDLNVWVPFRRNGLAYALGDPDAILGPPNWTTAAAMATVVGLAILLVAAEDVDRTPAAFVALPVVAFLLVSPYPSAWYLGWIAPLVALLWTRREARVVLLFFSLVLVTYHYAVALFAEHGAAIAEALDEPAFRALRVAAVLTAMSGVVVIAAGALMGVVRPSAPMGPPRPLREARNGE